MSERKLFIAMTLIALGVVQIAALEIRPLGILLIAIGGFMFVQEADRKRRN